MAVQKPTPLTVFQNASKTWTFTFKDHNDAPIDLSDFTFTSAYMSQRGKTPLGTFSIDTSDVSTGTLYLTVDTDWSDTAEISISKPERILEYQLNITDSLGKTIPVYGPFIVSRSSL